MALTSLHQTWRIESDEGMSASFGPVGGTYSTFGLTGDDREELALRFVGTGIGASVGARVSAAQEMALEAATGLADRLASPGIASDSSPVWFAGRERTGQSFGGVGHLIELAATPGVGLTFQVALFNIALGPAQAALAVDIVIKIARGELNQSRLNQLAPAVALIYAPSLGASVGATLYVGHFDVAVPWSTPRIPRDGAGARQSMNRRIRPRR